MTISDDKIVEAMLDAWYFGKNWRSKNVQFLRIDMLAALAAAKPLIAQQARENALDEAAKVVEPTSRRPCACDRCYCGNYDDAAEVAVWDSENENAKRILALKEPRNV